MNKTKVYVDVSNIFLALKNNDFEIDFLKLQTYLVDRFRPEKIIYFAPNISVYKNIFKSFEDSIFVECVYKYVYNEKGVIKANCDVDIAHRLTKDIHFNNVGNIILISGDGDFLPLFNYAKESKKNIRVIAATRNSCSLIIKRMNDLKCFLLTDLGNLVLVKKEKPPIET